MALEEIRMFTMQQDKIKGQGKDKDIQVMTKNEFMLIETIRNHPNPEQAMIKAVEIIVEHLKKNEELLKVGA